MKPSRYLTRDAYCISKGAGSLGDGGGGWPGSLLHVIVFFLKGYLDDLAAQDLSACV